MGLGILTIVIMLFILVRRTEAPSRHRGQDRPASRSTDTDNSRVTMLATGDWIAHDAINAAAQTETGYDYSSMTKPFNNIFAQSDVNFCNLATLAGGEEFGITGYPVFNAPLEWNRDMAGLGCNVINTGTNHTNDKGQGPITAELNDWDKIQGVLAVAGANRNQEEQQKVRYFEEKGVKFAFLSYSTYSNTPNPHPYSLNRFEDSLVLPQMQEAKANADIVIVSMRWGTEYSDDVNSAQISAAQKLAGLGADIILGHGTHTLQAVDKLTQPDGSETIVWYGLGNFLNAQLEVGGLTGCVARLTIDTSSKNISSNECLPFYQHYDWSATDKANENLMARKNFLIMPLYQAQDYISKSQLGTSVEEQTARIQKAVNSRIQVKLINN